MLLLATAIGAIGAGVWLGLLRDAARTSSASPITWWAELLGCYVAALCCVHVRIERLEATLSLAEVPLAVGLFLVDPHVLLGCYVAGALAARVTRRGPRLLEDYGTLMRDVLYVAIAVLVFTAIAPDRASPLAGRSILALAGAAAAAGWLVGPVVFGARVFLYRGALRPMEMLRGWAVQAAVATANTSLGVVALLFIVDRPVYALALVPLVVLALLGQRAAGESRRRADRMQFLYRTSEVLHSSLRIDERAGELLAGIVAMFGVARAELLVIPEMRGAAFRFVSRGGEAAAVASAELTFAEQETLNLLRTERMTSGSERDVTSPMSLLLAERGAEAGTAVGLRGHDRPQGLLLLLDPLRTSHPGGAERELLLTVAAQVSVALENGQLADAIRTMTAEKHELTRRAFYDPLTQIANRSLFIETVTKALGRIASTHRPVATLFIDLDGFKEVNDTYGHAAGDEVLSLVAARLRDDIRKLDMVARIGGDEFGILLNGMRHPSDAAVVAQRMVDILQQPLQLGDQTVRIGGSVGVALAEDSLNPPSAEEMLRRSDMAMYLAKRQGKNRLVVFDTASRDMVVATPAPS